MALTKTRVTGRLPLPNDEIWQDSFVEFKLRAADTDKASRDVLVPKPVIAPLSADGQISIDLWPNGRGELGTVYEVTLQAVSPVLRKAQPVSLGVIAVPALGPVDLVELLKKAGPLPNIPDLLAQIIAVLEEARRWALRAESSVGPEVRQFGVGSAAITEMARQVGYVRVVAPLLLNADVTVDVPIYFEPGARIVGAGRTLTIRSDIESPNQQIFADGLNVVLGHSGTTGHGENAREVHVSWFGAFPSSISPVVSAEAAMQRAFDAVGNSREAVILFEMGNYRMRAGCLVGRGTRIMGKGRRRTVFLLEGDGWAAFRTLGPAVSIENCQVEQPPGSTPRESPFFVFDHIDFEVRSFRGGYSRKNFVLNAGSGSIVDAYAVYSQDMGEGSSFIEVNGGSFVRIEDIDLRSSAFGPEAVVKVNSPTSGAPMIALYIDGIKALTQTIPVFFEATGSGVIQSFSVTDTQHDYVGGQGAVSPAVIRLKTSGTAQIRIGSLVNIIGGAPAACAIEILAAAGTNIRDMIVDGVTLGGPGDLIRNTSAVGTVSRILVSGVNATSRVKISGSASGIQFMDGAASTLTPPGPFANDGAAAAAGVAVGALYRTAGGATAWRQA